MRNRNPFIFTLAVLIVAGHHASSQDHVGPEIITADEHPLLVTDFTKAVRKENVSPLVWVAEDPVVLAEAGILDGPFDPVLFAEAEIPNDPFHQAEVEIIKQKTMTPEPRIYLGVALSPVSEALRSHLKLRKNSGILVNHVIEDSPAQKGGILQHDVLTHIDDQLLLNQEQLVSLLATYNDGDTVAVHLFREGAQLEIPVILHEKALPPIIPEIPRLAPPAPLAWDLSGNAVKHDFGFDPATPIKDVIAALEKLNDDQDISLFSPGAVDSVNIKKNASVVLQSAEGLSAVISQKNGEKYLTLRDKENAVLFDGPSVETTDLFSKVPTEYHNALKAILDHNSGLFQPGRRSESPFSRLFQKNNSPGHKSPDSTELSTSSQSSTSRSIQVNDGERTISFSSGDGVDSLKVTEKEAGREIVIYDGPANNAALGKIPFPHKPVVRKFLQDNGIISPSSK